MSSPKQRTGRFYGVGVGPGDPELLTLKARNVLRRVPVIFVPKKARESESLAGSILSGLVDNPEQRITELVFPMTRDKGRLRKYWQKAADVIWQHLSGGEDGAFISVGDPLLYGTFIHVLEQLKTDHPEAEVEVVPGVSSISAAAAGGVMPLAVDDERIAIISSAAEDSFLKETLQQFDTIVFMKTDKTFDRIIAIIEEMNLTSKCLFVRRCTTQEEEIVRDVTRLRGRKPDYFSLLIVRR
jgi:precorrin-2/cobalt-factor-2 C20-methyltransferase